MHNSRLVNAELKRNFEVMKLFTSNCLEINGVNRALRTYQRRGGEVTDNSLTKVFLLSLLDNRRQINPIKVAVLPEGNLQIK
jgi:hypothetical protein